MTTDQLKELPIDQIRRNPEQPRKHFDQGELQKLAASIEATGGVIQPIIVTKREVGWQIVAGERRWRACQLAKMGTVLCRVLERINEKEIAQYALLENLDRVELSPTEIGHAYAKLEQSHGMSQSEIARWVGRDRTEVNRYIALTKLPAKIQKNIDRGELSVGHAKVLLGASGPEREGLAALCIKKGWSVRRLEKEMERQKTSATAGAGNQSGQGMLCDLTERLGVRCSIRPAGEGSHVLRIESFAPDTLVGTLRNLADEIEAHCRKQGKEPKVIIELSGPLEVFDFVGE